ncbi:hypothetical protein [Lysinibacillus xylanilyticus]|uniref:hypothetical protein n=1 Tax=Lysinibacillus xylanilyticus TaxID=582475 RepID=UPI003817E645
MSRFTRVARSRVSGQQMFFARKRSANAASAASMLVTKALSQDVMVLAFVPLFANPQGVAQSPLQSTYIHGVRFNKYHPKILVVNPYCSFIKTTQKGKETLSCLKMPLFFKIN